MFLSREPDQMTKIVTFYFEILIIAPKSLYFVTLVCNVETASLRIHDDQTKLSSLTLRAPAVYFNQFQYNH